MTEQMLRDLIDPEKNADREWYLSLLEEEQQLSYEQEHLAALLKLLKLLYISRHQKRIAELRAEAEELRSQEGYGAEEYRMILELNARIASEYAKLNEYKCFFSEPYFARMDVVDDKEGYNSYYIGKKGDVALQIVDWRAPLAVRYYQKSRVRFTINEYDYRTVLRRALSVHNGKLEGFKNEYLSVRDVLTEEEIAGRDEEILFDPYLRSIIQSRKDDSHVRDIIRTIQEQQFAIITLPERDNFVLQGCAGSGKTMILLHRLSYLMYNNEALRPGDVLVITPSDSFNAFIDELAQVLELQRVKTTTLKNYFFLSLKNDGVDLESKLTGEREPEAYLAYLYSPRWRTEIRKKVAKLYGGLVGLFSSPECREVSERLLADCVARKQQYARIKNASTRIRRTVLGETKESAEGGIYFTKPFRHVMTAFVTAEDFLVYVLKEKERTPDYFFRQFVEFFRASKLIAASADKVFAQAQSDLGTLTVTLDKEIADLKRYRVRHAEGEVYTYADRIARRTELKEEAARISALIGEMEKGLDLYTDFHSVMCSMGACTALGKCKNAVDVIRFLYRETVKKVKDRFGMKGIYPSDGFALLYVLSEAGRTILPRYGLVFIDEGQDISEGEYELLHRIHRDASFDVFGDLKQNITPWRGVKSWECLHCAEYSLNVNYRNPGEIVDFVSGILDVDMVSVGVHGEQISRLRIRSLSAFFRDAAGTKAVIAKEEYLPLFDRRGYWRCADGELSSSKINVMSVFESKGLEFTSVAVYDRGMTENEKYIAYTRALSRLAIVED